MVESNINTTIGSPIEWYKLEVLRDVVNVKEAWESYSKNESSGLPVDNGVIRARTQSLFNSLVAYLRRKMEVKEFENLKEVLFFNHTIDDRKLRDIFWRIQTQLDADNITKMDTRRSYDGTRVEKENENFGD